MPKEKDYTQEGFNLSVWKNVFKEFKSFIPEIVKLNLFNITIAFTGIALPLLNRYAVDELIYLENPTNNLIIFIIIYCAIILIETYCHLAFFRVAAKAEMGIAKNLRMKCFKKLQELSFAYYDVTPSGWLLSRMTSDITLLAEITCWSFAEFGWGFPYIIVSLIIMFMTNVNLTILIILVLPLLVLVSFFFEKNILQAYRVVRKNNSEVTSAYSEGINGALTTKTMGLEANNLAEFKTSSHQLYTSSVKAAHLNAYYRPLTRLILALAMALAAWFGGLYTFKGILTFGSLLMFTSYATHFFEPIEMFAYILQDIHHAQANAERIFELLATEPTIVDKDGILEKEGDIFNAKKDVFKKIKGDIQFKNVDFYYNENEPVLNNFNLSVKAGQTIALVGQTGSGKSTIVNLLCRFYEPVKGELLIDGEDYRQHSLSWLHSQLGYVLQTSFLFSGTIRENIMFGNIEASETEMIEAAKLVRAHEFISQLKDGYDTEVGEGGARLSEGQKQLISFARAIIAKPSIFILDEATSAIDTETENIIQFAIENLMKDHTTFVIAHRLSTIVNADRILVIDKGQIIEDGNHDELMAKGGHYYKLYLKQFEDITTDSIM